MALSRWVLTHRLVCVVWLLSNLTAAISWRMFLRNRKVCTVSEELFERFKNVPRAKLLIEQFKDSPLDDKTRGISFLLSLACNVQMDIVAMHVIYNDLVEAATPYMGEDEFEEAVKAVSLQILDDIQEVAEEIIIDHQMDSMISGLEALLGEEKTNE